MTPWIKYPDAETPTYYVRFTAPDPENPNQTKRWVYNTGATSVAEALKRGRAARKAARNRRFDALEATRQRSTAPAGPTLADVHTMYRAFPERVPSQETRLANIQCLRLVLRRALAYADDTPDETLDELPVSTLTADLVRRFREATLAAAGDPEPERLQQVCRSANSTLRQARSLFARHLLSYYASRKLSLPDTAGFLREPGFRRVAKDEYHAPGDLLLARTFARIEELETQDPNLFLACWLAIGFGLRKGEISAARCGWFTERDGRGWLSAEHVCKNQRTPNIPALAPGWEKLKPFIAGQPAEKHVLAGTLTERRDRVFRRVAAMMRALGWETEKAIHEFRAWAGCQVGLQHGVLEGSRWMRHESTTVYEQHYGRYLRAAMNPTVLRLPSLVPTAAPTAAAPTA